MANNVSGGGGSYMVQIAWDSNKTLDGTSP